MSVDECEQALSEALADQKRVAANRAADIEAMSQKWAPDVTRTTAAVNLAKIDLAKAKEAACAHPWIGKTVVMALKKKVGGPSYRPVFETFEARGVVEVIGPSNQWSGRGYDGPGPGGLAVRLLKKDGKPGLKHDRFADWWSLDEA